MHASAQACIDDIEACAVQPIGNGPFEIEEWQQGVSLTANRMAGKLTFARRQPGKLAFAAEAPLPAADGKQLKFHNW